MKITAKVRWRGFDMDVAWEDGQLSGDKDAITLLTIEDWHHAMPPVPPAGYETAQQCPWAFANMLEETFEEVLEIVGLPTLPPGDIMQAPA